MITNSQPIEFINRAIYEKLLSRDLAVLAYCTELEERVTAHQITEEEQRRGLIEKDARIADLLAKLRVYELADDEREG